MDDGGYRDARTGIFQRVRDLDAAIEQRRKRMTEALVRLLPSALARRIEELEPSAIAEDATRADLSQAAEQRESLVHALDEALSLAPTLASDVRAASTLEGCTYPPHGSRKARGIFHLARRRLHQTRHNSDPG
ncbi:MAG: hypothetical protein FWD69_12580 [Polyangiaceae bacterium]|nr:hypothetical protein [Polyangiaceae bacterium]